MHTGDNGDGGLDNDEDDMDDAMTIADWKQDTIVGSPTTSCDDDVTQIGRINEMEMGRWKTERMPEVDTATRF